MPVPLYDAEEILVNRQLLVTDQPNVLDKYLKKYCNLLNKFVIAIDTERHIFKQFVCTIQIAMKDIAILYSLTTYHSLSPFLIHLLKSTQVYKIFIQPKEDIIGLKKIGINFKIPNIVNLCDFVEGLGYHRRTGLAKLCCGLLRIRLNKPKKITISKWSNWPLSKEQKTYALLDAACTFELAVEISRQLGTNANQWIRVISNQK